MTNYPERLAWKQTPKQNVNGLCCAQATGLTFRRADMVSAGFFKSRFLKGSSSFSEGLSDGLVSWKREDILAKASKCGSSALMTSFTSSTQLCMRARTSRIAMPVHCSGPPSFLILPSSFWRCSGCFSNKFLRTWLNTSSQCSTWQARLLTAKRYPRFFK